MSATRELDQELCDRYLFFGYARECTEEMLYDHDGQTMNIPDYIMNVCLSYYNVQPFMEIPAPLMPYLTVSGVNNNVIERPGVVHRQDLKGCTFSVYTYRWIESNSNKKYEWTIAFEATHGVAIGIVNNNHHLDATRWIDSANSYYYEHDGKLRVNGKRQYPNTLAFSKQMTLVLDLKAQTISIKREETASALTVFKDVVKNADIKYKFAISLWKRAKVILKKATGHYIDSSVY